MKTKIISMILSLSMCVTLVSCGDKSSTPAVVADDGTETDEYVYMGNGTSAWCSSLFEGLATEYNNELALVAAEMSDAAENDNGDDKTIKEKFSEYSLYACEYYNFDGTDLFSAGGAFAIGQDTLTINGVNTTVLVVVARGTKTLREIIGDWAHGGEIYFLGTKVWNNVYDFEGKILDGINDYITKYPAIQSAEHLKILVTGHSLGGAAANMFGARLTQGVGSGEWWGDKLSEDDIYVYTFGAIKVLITEDNITAGYENIHNVYNYYDSYGPNGNQKGTNASSLNAKFGHTEIFTFINREENGESIFDSCNNHIMRAYLDALKAVEEGSGSISLACGRWAEPPLEESGFLSGISKGNSLRKTWDEYVDSIGELTVYYVQTDYDGDGTDEAFAITGYFRDDGCDDVKIYFISPMDGISCVRNSFSNNRELFGNLRYLKGGLEKSYIVPNVDYKADDFLLQAGKSKFLVWEIDGGGSSSISLILGVRDGKAYEPDISGKYMWFWYYNNNFVATEVNRSGMGTQYIDRSFTYNDASGQFTLIKPELGETTDNPENTVTEEKKCLNRS